MTRTLGPPPSSFLDKATGRPAFGSYAGPLPLVGPEPSFVARLLRRKRWVYLALANDDFWIALAVVRTGYAATAFGFAYDLTTRHMLDERKALGPSAHVADDPHAEGMLARFSFARTELSIERRGEEMHVDARFGSLVVQATLDTRAAPQISAIADLGGGCHDATEKQAPIPVRGRATVAGLDISLDGALAGWDFTSGIMPRRTRWRWAFALGKTKDGASVALNVVSGFVGEAECALFLDGVAHPLAEPRIHFTEPLGEWRLEGDGIDLRFVPGAMHAEYMNLGVVRSRFVQPVGRFTGTVVVGGRTVRFDGVPGVVEDQDVVW